MTQTRLFLALTFILLVPAGIARGDQAPAALQIRAVLHDPVNPSANLFLADKSGTHVKLNLVAEGLSKPQYALPVDGSLVLYDSATIDPKNPTANVATSVRIPPDTKRAVLVILPAPPDTKPAYRMVLVDDSFKAFPKGESRVISLVPVEMAMEAGEHKLPLHPGKITQVPVVTKVNEFNMAQTNFYYKQDESWVPFTERQLQYLDAFRRIFIIHVTPGAIQPTVTTVTDTSPVAVPP
jgi:hypothetical protein